MVQRISGETNVVSDAFAVRRFGQHDEVVLDAPPQQNLSRRPTDLGRDPVDRLIAQMATGAERAVRLESSIAQSLVLPCLRVRRDRIRTL